MSGVMVSDGRPGWFKVKDSEIQMVESSRTNPTETFDVRENQNVLTHSALTSSLLSSLEELNNMDTLYTMAHNGRDPDSGKVFC